MQSKGGRKYVSSDAVLTDLENIKIKQKQHEERIRRPDSDWLFKGKEVNRILEEYIYIQRLCVVFLSLSKINRITVSFFVKKIWLARLPTVYCSLFNFLEGKVCFRGFKEITELHLFFLIKLSFGPYTRNPFALEGYHWVVLSVLSLFILFPVVFSVAFWSSFAYARTILYFFTSIYH